MVNREKPLCGMGYFRCNRATDGIAYRSEGAVRHPALIIHPCSENPQTYHYSVLLCCSKRPGMHTTAFSGKLLLCNQPDLELHNYKTRACLKKLLITTERVSITASRKNNDFHSLSSCFHYSVKHHTHHVNSAHCGWVCGGANVAM